MESSTNIAPKIKIILKPGVLNLQQPTDNLAQQQTKARAKKINKKECPIPTSITLINPTPQENKFSVKMRNVLDGLTFAVQDYIIHNLDNEATSQAYKTRLQTGLGKIREDFISSRISGSNITSANQSPSPAINPALNNPAI